MNSKPTARAGGVARLAGALAVVGCIAAATAQDALDSDVKKFSYYMGIQAGNQLKQRGMAEQIDTEAMRLGLQDALDGVSSKVSAAEVQRIGQKMQAAMAQERTKMAEVNQAKADAFFADNKGKDGIVTTESGVQYQILTAGDGPKPTAEQRVRVHYRGTLLNDTEFDSSYRRGQPAEFGVTQVIPGWQEALQLMTVGSKWEVWIPPQLAYGERGAGARIGPNEALHFTIELLDIVDG